MAEQMPPAGISGEDWAATSWLPSTVWGVPRSSNSTIRQPCQWAQIISMMGYFIPDFGDRDQQLSSGDVQDPVRNALGAVAHDRNTDLLPNLTIATP